MNGLHNGLYDGRFDGLQQGLFDNNLDSGNPGSEGLFIFDPDALNYIIAANIVNPTHRWAINVYFIGLKSNHLYNKIYAMWLLIGGNANSHKYNAKDPRDLDAAYRLTFAGGYTHDDNGIKGNGTNSITSTYFPADLPDINDISLAVYSRTAGNSSGAEIGFSSGLASPRLNLTIQYTNGNTCFDLNNTYLGTAVALSQVATGLYVSSRTANNVIKLYRRGNLINTQADVSTTEQTQNISFGALAGGGYTVRQTCFYAIMRGLTDSEVLIFNRLVHNLQIALGRNIY